MNVPNHIAIILDGNGRWAKAKGMPRSYGHVKGCANLETVCDYMKELGVKYVTVYSHRLYEGAGSQICDCICFFHRELETFQR